MSSPYTALLALRRVEEQQAEIALAEALREVAAVERSLARLRESRAAWLEQRAEAAAGEGLVEAMTALQAAERDAEERLRAAWTRAAGAREQLLERQRQRKTVEQLHHEALAAEARAAARRAQAELDELGSRVAAPFTEDTPR